MSDLAGLLRALAGDCENTDGWEDGAATCTEAADELTALRTQISDLRADLEVACGALEEIRVGASGREPIPARQASKNDHLAVVLTCIGLIAAIERKARATLNTIRKDG